MTNFFVKKDLIWCGVGVNKLINQYENCRTRYGDYVEKYNPEKFFRFEVHSLIFYELIEEAKFLEYPSYINIEDL